MCDYFEKHHPYTINVREDKPAKAVEEALAYLAEKRKEMGETKYSEEHKGTPFYVLGCCAFACHDYTSASLYFDAAVEEDLQYHNGKLDTPALKFIQIINNDLNNGSDELLASRIIAKIETQINILIDDYRCRQDHVYIDLNTLRNCFLQRVLQDTQNHKRTLLTAFISFVAEGEYRSRQLELVPEGSREPFFLHMFRGCLLFESLLKNAPNAPPIKTIETIGKALNHYKTQLNVSEFKTSANKFDDIVAALKVNMKIGEAINSCAQARNTLGHNLVWTTTTLTSNNYNLLIKNIGVSCLHVISTLYK